MKIGITGAEGLLGRALLARLRGQDNVTVTALTRRIREQEQDSNVRWIKGDLLQSADCDAFVSDLDVVFHFAHKNSPLTSDSDWVQDAQLNLLPSLNLLSAIERAQRKPHLVYPSSGGAIYGNPLTRHALRETDPCLPLNSYGIQKLAVEHYLRVFVERGLLTATVLRIGNAYGWLLPEDRSQGFIGTAINRIHHHHPVRIIGDPGNVRDYVHGDDIADAICMAAKRPVGYEVFNIGTGEGFSVTDIIDIIARLTGRQPITETFEVAGAARLPPWCVLDIHAAQTRLGWTPRVSLEQGIQRMLANMTAGD